MKKKNSFIREESHTQFLKVIMKWQKQEEYSMMNIKIDELLIFTLSKSDLEIELLQSHNSIFNRLSGRLFSKFRAQSGRQQLLIKMHKNYFWGFVRLLISFPILVFSLQPLRG